VQVKDFPLFIHSKLSLCDYYVSAECSVARIARTGRTVKGRVSVTGGWTVFVSNHSTYVSVSCARLWDSATLDSNTAGLLNRERVDCDVRSNDAIYTPVVLDRGNFDGVRRVLFGAGFEFWLHRVLFLDAISFLSHGQLSQPLERFILVDVDDVFVGRSGVRVTADDVKVQCSCFVSDSVYIVFRIYGRIKATCDVAP